MSRRGAIGGIALLVCASCAPAPAGKPAATVAQTAGATAPAGTWSYDVDVADDARALDVVAIFPAGTPDALSPDDVAVPFVERVEGRATPDPKSNAPWQPLALKDGSWSVPCTAGCALRYRLRLGDLARATNDTDSAMEVPGAIEAPPSTWLVRPSTFAPGTTYRLHVKTHGEARFATGVHPIDGAPDTYGARADDVDSAPYTLFGKLRLRTLKRSDATIELATLDGPLGLDDAAMDHWIDLSARAVTAYYGHFPVKRLLLVMIPTHHGHGTPEGRTLAGGGSTILMGLSDQMTAADIPRDWVLTHEMTHLASPSLPRPQHWLEEGMATYIEPLARAYVGTIPPEEVWTGLVDGLPNGEPDPDDRGLDNTHTWGRTYWGGAMFCFVADVEIRRRTQNKASFETAMRGVLDGLGSGEIHATIDDVLKAGDRATGVPVLQELHAQMGSRGDSVDLGKLWSALGIRDTSGKISYDEGAPLAAIRKTMTVRK